MCLYQQSLSIIPHSSGGFPLNLLFHYFRVNLYFIYGKINYKIFYSTIKVKLLNILGLMNEAYSGSHGMVADMVWWWGIRWQLDHVWDFCFTTCLLVSTFNQTIVHCKLIYFSFHHNLFFCSLYFSLFSLVAQWLGVRAWTTTKHFITRVILYLVQIFLIMELLQSQQYY